MRSAMFFPKIKYNNYYVFEKHNTQPTTESEYKKTFHLSLISIGYVYLKNTLSHAFFP